MPLSYPRLAHELDISVNLEYIIHNLRLPSFFGPFYIFEVLLNMSFIICINNIHIWVNIYFSGCLHFLSLSSKIGNFCHTESCRTKKWEEFCQKSIGAFVCSLPTSYDDWRRCSTSVKLTGTDYRHANRQKEAKKLREVSKKLLGTRWEMLSFFKGYIPLKIIFHR